VPAPWFSQSSAFEGIKHKAAMGFCDKVNDLNDNKLPKLPGNLVECKNKQKKTC
jgi:hypothetical protein